MIDLRKNDNDIIGLRITRQDLKIFKLIKKLNITFDQLKADLLKCEQERNGPQLRQGEIIFNNASGSEKEQHKKMVTMLSEIEQEQYYDYDNSKNTSSTKPTVWCEFVGFLGNVNVEHPIMGKSFIFKIGCNGLVFEAILFLHESLTAFVTVENNDVDPHLVLLMIKKHYDFNELLNYNEKEL